MNAINHLARLSTLENLLKHYRKTLDEVLRVETEQGTEPSKYLGIAGKHTVSEMLERADLRVRIATEKKLHEKLYSTCASPVVPHPSTGHAHGCLASEIGRDPAFPTRFDRTVDSPEVSLLASSTTSP